MNVIFLCSGYRAPYSGNFIPSLKKLEKRLKPGRCVYIFHNSNAACDWCRELMNEGSSVEFLDFDASFLRRIRDLLGLIDRYEADIVHVHFGEKITPSVCGLLRPQTRIFWHIHSDWSMGRRFRPGLKAVLEFVKNRIAAIIGCRAEKIAVSEVLAKRHRASFVPNGIDIGRIYRLSDNREEKRKLGLEPDSVAVLVFGWSPEVKGVDIAVNAVGRLRAGGKIRYELMIVTGKDDTDVRRWIADHTSYSPEADFLHYLPPVEDVYLYHNAADVFLSASRSEGFSYTLCEAVCIAKPCASTDIHGVRWAKDFKSVAFFENGSVAACAGAIDRLVRTKNEPSAICLRESDCARALAGYNADLWAERISGMYLDAEHK